jgi:hypothetical protein
LISRASGSISGFAMMMMAATRILKNIIPIGRMYFNFCLVILYSFYETAEKAKKIFHFVIP